MKQGRMRVEIPLQRWLVIPSHVIPSVDEGEDEGCVGEEEPRGREMENVKIEKRSMFNAQRSMLNAQCSMLNAREAQFL